MHLGDGLNKKKKHPKLRFHFWGDVPSGPNKEDGNFQLNVFFYLDAFGHLEFPMELPGDFQDNFRRF